MNQLTKIPLLLCLLLFTFGCQGNNAKTRSTPENLKLADLAPAHTDMKVKPLQAVNFQIHIFQVPAENTDKLDDISKILYSQPFRFNHFNAFTANGFSAGFGRISSGNQIFNILSAANSQKIGSISLLVNFDQPDDITIQNLLNSTSIYFTAADGSTQSKTIGPGRLTLRINARQIPTFRGTCNVTFAPASPSPLSTALNLPSSGISKNDLIFDSCLFSLPMSKGDFVFLRPVQYISHQSSIGSLFFSRPNPKPSVLAFLIVCIDIND